MATVGDIYRVECHCLHPSGVSAISVFYYEFISGDAAFDAEDAANEVIDNILAETLGALSNNSRWNRVDSINGMDNDDFFSTNPDDVGILSGNPLAAQIAAAMRSPWNGPGTRRANKRFMLGLSIHIDGIDGIWDSGLQTELSDLAVNLGAQLENANGFIRPCTIVGAFALGVSPTRNEIIAGKWELNKFPSTQKTRQDYSWVLPS